MEEFSWSSRRVSTTQGIVQTPAKRNREAEGRNSRKRRKKKEKDRRIQRKGPTVFWTTEKWHPWRTGTRTRLSGKIKEEWRIGQWQHGKATVGVCRPLWRELDLGRVKWCGKLWLVKLFHKDPFASDHSFSNVEMLQDNLCFILDLEGFFLNKTFHVRELAYYTWNREHGCHAFFIPVP